MRRPGQTLVCIILVLSSHPSHGEGDPLRQGITHFQQGQLEQSLKRLDEALKREQRGARRPRQLGMIYLYKGLGLALMNQRQMARRAIARALTHHPELSLDPESFKPELLDLLASVRAGLQGRLSVSADLPGSSVRVDDRVMGVTPLVTDLPVGRHTVEVHAPGHPRVKRVVILSPARTTTLVLKISPIASGHRPLSFWQRRRLWTWVTWGGSVFFTVVGIGLWASANASYDEALALREQLVHADTVTQEERGTLEDLKTSVRAKDRAAAVMLSLSGALAAAGVVLLFVEGRGATKRSTRLMPMLGTSSAGLHVITRF